MIQLPAYHKCPECGLAWECPWPTTVCGEPFKYHCNDHGAADGCGPWHWQDMRSEPFEYLGGDHDPMGVSSAES